MTEKSLGQIAYEFHMNYGYRSFTPWDTLDLGTQNEYHALASAVAEECAAIAEQQYAAATAIRRRILSSLTHELSST